MFGAALLRAMVIPPASPSMVVSLVMPKPDGPAALSWTAVSAMVCPHRAGANVIRVAGPPGAHSPAVAPEAAPLLADVTASGKVQTPSSATPAATLVTVMVAPAETGIR
jgi:hypothetical protein